MLSARSSTRVAGADFRHGKARTVVVRVFETSNGTSASFADGAKVKVVKPIKVFHVPKHPEVDLEGLEGLVNKNCANYKGKVLSPNLPIQVRFDKPVKFLAHLAEDEIELVQ